GFRQSKYGMYSFVLALLIKNKKPRLSIYSTITASAICSTTTL
ncbi:MAG: hypothetical protein ACI90V_009753, partial [Bacillariaceae sp.]